MYFPIDKETFDKKRNGRAPKEIFTINIRDLKWRYWMTTEGNIFAIIGDKMICFDENTDLMTGQDQNAWSLTFLNENRPKEAILNHIQRGGSLMDTSDRTSLSGMYLLTCGDMSYEVYLFFKEWEWMSERDLYVWWPGKTHLISSLPLIFEMKEFFRAVLWKKF